jgi:hypothetical protein
MPLGAGFLGGWAPPAPTEATTTAVSCRRIDAVAHDYVTDGAGNPEGMDGTANRVYLLLSYADTRTAIITATGVAAREKAVRAALEPLARGPEPAIANLSVKVTDAGRDRVYGEVTYRNLLTNTLETLVIR